MGNDAAFDVLRLNFLSFLGEELLKGYLRMSFNIFYGLEYLSEGKQIQLAKKERITCETQIMGSFKPSKIFIHPLLKDPSVYTIRALENLSRAQKGLRQSPRAMSKSLAHDGA